MNLLFLDTETTSADQTARLVQLAYKQNTTQKIVNVLFKPPELISFGAMAVTHTTNEMVEDKKAFEGSEEKAELIELLKDEIFVAHNAPFDIMVLNNEGVKVESYIDTLRIAQHLLESESYALQYLRYSLGIYKELEAEEITAHDALGDILVLEKLFFRLFSKTKSKFEFNDDQQVLEKMIELTNTPILIKEFAFGKYKGKTFEEVNNIDKGYLRWLNESETKKPANDQNVNLVYTLSHYLK